MQKTTKAYSNSAVFCKTLASRSALSSGSDRMDDGCAKPNDVLKYRIFILFYPLKSLHDKSYY